ncbi:hypothetical protein HAX54_017978 [Datura stramonium]|uniref:Uncharacterized protein n=1 Tax=Datura stramonium TaxID=4076 RepID=A0ABS8Y6T2_DATST|nr:hypothetical protein [Datura stramonium]
MLRQLQGMEPKMVTQGNCPTVCARCRPACVPARACVNRLARLDLAPNAFPSHQILGYSLPSRPAASAYRYATTVPLPTCRLQALTPALDPTMALATSYCATADTALLMPTADARLVPMSCNGTLICHAAHFATSLSNSTTLLHMFDSTRT